MHALILFALLQFIPFQGLPGERSVRDDIIHQYTTADGLPDNSIRTLYKDSRGFLWLGMKDGGLVRYDGADFEQIVCSDGTAEISAFSHIERIREDGYGHLWIESQSASVACYDLASGRFVPSLGESVAPRRPLLDKVTLFDGEVWLWSERGSGLQQVIVDAEGLRPGGRFARDNGALISNQITYVEKGVGGVLWVGTRRGLHRISGDGKTQQYEASKSFLLHCSHAGMDYHLTDDGALFRVRGGVPSQVAVLPQGAGGVTGAVKRPDSWLVFCTGGTWLYSFVEGTFSPAPDAWNLPAAQTQMLPGGQGVAYNGAGRILYIPLQRAGSPENGNVRVFDIPAPDPPITALERLEFAVSREERLWIATEGAGLYCFTPSAGRLEKVPLETGLQDPQAGFLCGVLDDGEGHVWAAGEYVGLIKISRPERGASFVHLAGREDASPLSEMVRMVRIVDAQAWVSTSDRLLYRLHLPGLQMDVRPMRFPAPVECVLETSDGQILLGTDGDGLHIGEAILRHVPADSTSIGGNHVLDLVEDAAGRIWAALSEDGLCVGTPDAEGGYRFATFFAEQYPNPDFRTLLVDRSGRIWAGTDQGVIIFRPDELIADPAAYGSYPLVGKGPFNNEVNDLLEDREGRIWIASNGRGLFCTQPDGSGAQRFIQYTTSNGLVNNRVQGIVEDRQGRLWVATVSGVSCLTPATGQFTNYHFSGKIQGDKNNDGAQALLPDGSILSGTNNGLLRILPTPQWERREASRQLFVKVWDRRTRSVLENPERIVLAHRYNSLRVRFSNLQYNDETRYSWMLEGFDEDWHPAARIGQAEYQHVPPGRYTLRVRTYGAASSQDASAAIPVRVVPPLAASAGAICIYVVLFCVLATGLFLMFRRLSKLKVEAQLDRKVRDLKAEYLKEQMDTGFLHKMNEIMESNVSNPDFSVDDFAAAMAMGRSSFYAKVGEVTGDSPNRFIRAFRLNKAATLLLDDQYTIEQVAFMVGIRNSSYFGKLFKEEFGRTPKEYKSGMA